MVETKTFVIQDWLGLFHIFKSNKTFKEVWVEWILNEKIGKFAIDTEDLREKLKEENVETIHFYSCREKHD